MQLHSMKAAVAAVWISAVWAGGLAGNVSTLSGWTILVGVAVLPTFVMLWRWNDPGQTMSEAIQEALR